MELSRKNPRGGQALALDSSLVSCCFCLMQIATDCWIRRERTEALRKAYLHEGSVEISFYGRMSPSRLPESQVLLTASLMFVGMRLTERHS